MADLSTIYATTLGFMIAFSSFAVITMTTTPAVLPAVAVDKNGLVHDIVFSQDEYRVLETVSVRFVYRNPSDRSITFNLTYPAKFSQTRFHGPLALGEKLTDWKVEKLNNWKGDNGTLVTLLPGDEYVVGGAGDQALYEEWFSVEWNGIVRGMKVSPNGLVAKIVTDKNYYERGEFGYATLEYYNPGQTSITVVPPFTIELNYIQVGRTEYPESGGFFDWIGKVTVNPGETWKVHEFVFMTPTLGKLTISGMGAQKVVWVIPAPD